MRPVIVSSKKKKGICSAYRCTNKAQYTLCSSCRCRKSRMADPVRYAYHNIKHRAEERDIYFDLTLEQFRKFCIRTKYIAGKGRSADSFTIDRKIEGKLPGYTISNIQKLRKDKNVRKYFLHYNWMNRSAKVVSGYKQPQHADNPF